MALDRDIERALVLGLGKVTGRASAEALLASGISVKVSEIDPSDLHRKTAADLGAKGAEVSFGQPDPALLDWADLIVPSPGVPPSNPMLKVARDRGMRVWSELELGWRYCQVPVFAVTGTNGKTTTTMLLAKMLETGGFPAVAAGNIGLPFVDVARTIDGGWTIVCEASSFQLHLIDRFKPHTAIVLNVADDHYDWHGGYDHYLASKSRITENQTPEDLLIVSCDDAGALSIAANSDARVAAFGLDTPEHVAARAEHGTGKKPEFVGALEQGKLVMASDVRVTPLVDVADIRLEGVHNIENVLAGALAATSFGVTADATSHAVRGFESLPHRVTSVATLDGVTYVDDSKATNPHATLKALSGFESVVLIAGGRAKGLDLSVLGSASGVKAVVVIGEASQELKGIFNKVPVSLADDIETAVEMAQAVAEKGDTVLLSPACSSVDQFVDYAERGDRFQEAVRALVPRDLT